jgi:DNA repair exonuclease SbcCD ATPase subunit
VLEQQQELDFRASIQDSTGHSAPVVYTSEGVGVSAREREAILAYKSQLQEMENCGEKERSTLNAEIEELKAEKLAVEQKLADQLKKNLADEHAKDEQLNAKEEEISKLKDLVKELRTKLAAKKEELKNNMQEFQEQKNGLERQLKEKIAELRKQKEETETLRKEKEETERTLKHEREVSSLQIQIRDQQIKYSEEMRDQQFKHSKETQQLMDKQHQLELRQAATSNNGM